MLAKARKHFEPSKRYLGERLGRLGLPPSFWTLSGLVLAILSYTIYPHHPFQAALIGTAASLTDFVDGAVARYQKTQSAWGNYLEAVTDRLVELTLLLAMADQLGPVIAWAIAASMFISYTKPRVALVIEADNHDWPGIADHADRMVILLISMALSQFSIKAAQYGIAVLTLTAIIGSAQRLHYAYRLIAQNSTSAQKSPPD
ncbi:MAG: CDP-alcohol phosphatidyltransferase family protein [Candidatus Eremiobacteraeota bacterium]|nr:CDP-alcohol phosphatidyltransferase family protein [Candidatus Eremiobacteraeota bacterium]MCW5866705.1 CDP-alcohol phosphatidyltransferase family protein [Candidatus Eremiobacteraeota bacterium]